MELNQFSVKNDNDFILVQSNSQLLSHRTKDNKTRIRNWDVTPKCTNLTAYVAQLATMSLDGKSSTYDMVGRRGSAADCDSK